MRSRVRSRIATAAIPFLILTGPPADAANTDLFIIQGSGTIAPGLSLIPEPQSISFTGTAIVVGTDGIASTYSCSFSGGELAGSITHGTGVMESGCGPIECSSLVFVRVGNSWTWVCADGVAELGAFHCTYTPDDVYPNTSYDLLCEGAFVRAP